MKIKELLTRGRPTFSFEFFPPKSEEAARQLEQTITELQPLKPSFVSVTYGAGGSTRERTIEIVTKVKRETGIEAMAHLTCAGSTREDLSGVLGRIRDAGIENVLAGRAFNVQLRRLNTVRSGCGARPPARQPACRHGVGYRERYRAVHCVAVQRRTGNPLL